VLVAEGVMVVWVWRAGRTRAWRKGVLIMKAHDERVYRVMDWFAVVFLNIQLVPICSPLMCCCRYHSEDAGSGGQRGQHTHQGT
jgi:hypothetical protein